MIINRALRYEVKPNASQRILFAKHVGAARFAYNWGLKERIRLYEVEKTTLSAIEQHRTLNALKASEFPWMYEVSKCAPQEALRDLDRAFKNFFRGLKTGKSVGFPAFKMKGKKDSCRFTGAIKASGKMIQLPRIGTIRSKEKIQLKGRILSASLIREADRWYVSLTIEHEIENPGQVVGEAVGIDLGLSCFAKLSNHEEIHASKPLAKHLKRLQRASRQHSRKAKGSANRRKSALKLAKLHRRIRNIRTDFLHKATTRLTKTKSAIVIEDLDVRGMQKNGRLSRSISDAGWSTFRRMLEYKAQWYGSRIVIAPKFYPSSKQCSNCNAILAHLSLSTRQWTCPSCHKTHDRDFNAAVNLVKLYTGSSSGIYACGDTSCGTSQQLVSNVSLKQEINNGIFVHKL